MATVDSTAPIATPPPVLSGNPFRRVYDDLAVELRARGKYPPGAIDFNWARTTRVARDPLPILLGALSVHAPNGWLFTAPNGGWEYPAFLALAAFAHVLIGDGALALRPAGIPAAKTALA